MPVKLSPMEGAMLKTSSYQFISQVAAGEAEKYREVFQSAKPFKYVLIENFFDRKAAEELLSEFPEFDNEKARNELGVIGAKAARADIENVSPLYRSLKQYLSSSEFLTVMTRLTGIEDLELDPHMYGGGTHENRHGQELDAHIDFNYDEAEKLHRRLNLIVYLNKDWKPEWGGQIELHSNPRESDTNKIASFDPSFNRAIIFETNEISWHGFPVINLPPEERHRSRKSISIYYYTRTRPAHEIVPAHGTFYVQRPLPDRIKPGSTLSAEDYHEIRVLLKKRDDWIHFYHRQELNYRSQISNLLWRIEEETKRLEKETRPRSTFGSRLKSLFGKQP